MKKMVLACAVLIASVGLSFAQSNKKHSDAYNQGYMAASKGNDNSICEKPSVRTDTREKQKNQESVDCYQGYLQGISDKKNAERGNYNSNNR